MLDKDTFNQAISQNQYSLLNKAEVDVTMRAYPYFNVLERTQNLSQNTNMANDNAKKEEKVDYIYNDESHKVNAHNMVYSKDKHNDLNVDMVMQSLYGSNKGNQESVPAPEQVNLEEQKTHNPMAENTASESQYDDMALTQNHSFSAWLKLIKNKNQQKEEQKIHVENIKAEWQKKKLQDVLEEEPEVIDDEVFDMVINSVTQDDEIISEPLADLYMKQGYTEKAREVYEKLILKYPEKSAYFADLISKLDT